MKKAISLLLFLVTIKGIAQVEQQSAVGTKVLYFDNSGLLDMSDEQLTPLSDSSVGVYSASMKCIQAFEGVFYQAYFGNKYIYFRKSADAIMISKFPASVIVNEAMEIVHIHGDITLFLLAPQGKPTHNLIKMAREGLAFELRNAIHKATKEADTLCVLVKPSWLCVKSVSNYTQTPCVIRFISPC